MKRSKLAVIGLGNWLLSDEGTGLHAIESLKERIHREDVPVKPDVDLVDAGTPGMNLLHQFDEREKIIFIDAGNCGMQPGQYKRFSPDEAVSVKEVANHSLHEFDLIRFLDFARQMGKGEETEVVIYCMQAAGMEMSENLTPTVAKSLPHLVEDIYNEMKQGVNHAK